MPFFQELLNDLPKLILFITISLLILTFVIVFIFYFVSRKRDKTHKIKIQNQANTIRVFVIDIHNNTVRYFNRSHLRDQKVISVTDFYQQFPRSEVEKLVNWIDSLLDETKNTPNYLEIDIVTSKDEKTYFSMLQVEDINYDQQIIHLESYILRYLPTKVNQGKTKKASSLDEISKILLTNSPFKGVAIAFDFYYKRVYAKQKTHSLDALIFTQIKQLFHAHITPYRYYIEPSHHQIVVYDARLTSHSSILLFVHTLLNEINRFLSLNSMLDRIGVSVGLVEHKFFPNDGEKLLKQSLIVAKLARENNESVMWYEQGMRGDDAINLANQTEVENIIRNKKLKYFYRPILDIDKLKIIGYESFVEPFDTFFSSLLELKEYAIRTDDEQELFATTSRHLINRFINEKSSPYLRLYFDLLWQEKPFILKTLQHIRGLKEIHLVLVFKEIDLSEQRIDDEIIVNELRAYKVKGYEIALRLDDDDLLLNTTIYEMFDYFILDETLTKNIYVENRQRVKMRSLIEKLLKYKKQIIATDLDSWNAIELVIQSGIRFIASDVISPKDEMILPIAQKVLAKIKTTK